MKPGPEYGVPTRTWVDVIRRARVGRTITAVAQALALYADPDGTRVFPGVARLMVECELSKNSVKAALQFLREVQLILLVRTHPRHEYRLILGPDLLDLVDIPTPAQIDIMIEKAAAELRRAPAANRAQPTAWAVSEPDEAVDSPARGPSTDDPQPSAWAVDDDRTAHGVGENPAVQPTAWVQDSPAPDSVPTKTNHTPTAHDATDLRTDVTARARDAPAAKPERCGHGMKPGLRADGKPQCPMCRVGVPAFPAGTHCTGADCDTDGHAGPGCAHCECHCACRPCTFDRNGGEAGRRRHSTRRPAAAAQTLTTRSR